MSSTIIIMVPETKAASVSFLTEFVEVAEESRWFFPEIGPDSEGYAWWAPNLYPEEEGKDLLEGIQKIVERGNGGFNLYRDNRPDLYPHISVVLSSMPDSRREHYVELVIGTDTLVAWKKEEGKRDTEGLLQLVHGILKNIPLSLMIGDLENRFFSDSKLKDSTRNILESKDLESITSGGLFWLNYFGEDLLDRGQRENLKKLPKSRRFEAMKGSQAFALWKYPIEVRALRAFAQRMAKALRENEDPSAATIEFIPSLAREFGRQFVRKMGPTPSIVNITRLEKLPMDPHLWAGLVYFDPFLFGCYIGEVVRRQTNGHWIWTQDMIEWSSLAVEFGDRRLFPVEAAQQFLSDPQSLSLVKWIDDALKR